MAGGAVNGGGAPPRVGHLGASRSPVLGQGNGLCVRVQGHGRLQLQEGKVVRSGRARAGVVFVYNDLGEGQQLATHQALDAATADGIRAGWIAAVGDSKGNLIQGL